MIGISVSAQAFCNERDLETQQNASVCRCSVFSFLLGTIVKFKVKDYYPVTQVSIFFSKKNGGRLILQMLLAQKHTHIRQTTTNVMKMAFFPLLLQPLMKLQVLKATC